MIVFCLSLSAPSPEPFVVDAVIVARNCAGSLGPALAALPSRELRSVVVVDNGSTDATPLIAQDAGAVVLHEPASGYGGACRRAVMHLESLPRPPDVAVFLAGDCSDDPADLPALLAPIRAGSAELVVGVRSRVAAPEAWAAPDGGEGAGEGGARAAQTASPVSGSGRGGRRVADRVALGLIGLIYRHQFADLGRFRAIRFPALVALGLSDRGDGWDVEMQVKAVCFGLRIAEVPVRYREPLRPPGSRASELKDTLTATGRRLFQILRHATAR